MKRKEITTVTVIGAGDMGHGIAQAALLGGLIVHLYDTNNTSLQRGVDKINESLEILHRKGKIKAEEMQFCKTNLHPTLNFQEAIESSPFIFEAVPEIVELKRNLYSDMEKIASRNTIFASNTSNMKISEITKDLQYKDRVVGAHFFNPVVLMKLVEVIRGDETSDETMEITYDLCLKMNKTPVRVEKDSPSFIVNRINAPLRVFLGAIVDNEIAQPEEIDALMKFHGEPMGHFELADYVGLDVTYYSCQYRQQVLHQDYIPYKKLTEKVNSGELGKKAGKGFYDWSVGRPNIDVDKKTDKIKMSDIDLVKLNEAAKLIEEGVATPKDIDLAMVLGTGDKVGPIEKNKGIQLEDAINRLATLAKELNKQVLEPAKILSQAPENVFLWEGQR
ncbi:3-hydroxyacyl-CoA dehydrogenase NAD-binding domain-containing protein [Sporosarcina soli]|uniref:3-hydroxyacyl-CoA dehydrogenase NAD-binding domain-containing protein n=1 Tax=Sporosarcina soli TaxID=334736 RepID=A0ABW0TMV5_9BACL